MTIKALLTERKEVEDASMDAVFELVRVTDEANLVRDRGLSCIQTIRAQYSDGLITADEAKRKLAEMGE